MNWTHDLRSTATLSSMNAQPVEPWRLVYVHIFYAIYTNWLITFLERMLANSDVQFGIINQQQPLAFNHHPCHHHPQQPLLLTATINRLQPWHTTNNGETNSDVATPHHKPQRLPAQPQMMKNTQKPAQWCTDNSTLPCPTDSCRNGVIPLEWHWNPQEWHRNLQEWTGIHRNGTGVD